MTHKSCLRGNSLICVKVALEGSHLQYVCTLVFPQPTGRGECLGSDSRSDGCHGGQTGGLLQLQLRWTRVTLKLNINPSIAFFFFFFFTVNKNV